MPDKDIFQRTFSGGVSMTAEVSYETLKKSPELPWLNITFDGEPHYQMIPEYITWLHPIISSAAKKVHTRILYAFPPSSPSGNPQCFVYLEDGSYEEVVPPHQ